MAEKETENLFIKENPKSVRITSQTDFFEIFQGKDVKCHVKIPETVVLNEGTSLFPCVINQPQIQGQFKLWIFNSKTEKGEPILKKKENRLNKNSVLEHFVIEEGVLDAYLYGNENVLARVSNPLLKISLIRLTER
jgi:hypothetical protein